MNKRYDRMKKLLAIAVSAAMIVSLASCSLIRINRPSDDTAAPDSTTDVADKSDSRYEMDKSAARSAALSRVAALSDHDFSKGSFTVAVTPDENFIPDEPLDGYDDALVDRAKIAGDRYGVDFGQFQAPLELMLSDSYSNYLSGIYYADAMLIPQSAVAEFADKGHLLNSQNIPYIDYTAEWFDSDAMAQSTVGWTSPAIIGAAITDPDSYYCVYINTSAIDAATFVDVCASVENGDWTWQKLLETERAARDINGDIKAIGAKNGGVFAAAVCSSGGRSLLQTQFGSTPVPAFDTDSVRELVNVMSSLNSDGAIFDETSASSRELDDFRAGKSVFHIDTLKNMSEVTKMGADWCVLPLPKPSADADGYVGLCSSDAPVLVVNAVGSDPEDAAYALNALNAASYRYTPICYGERIIRTALNSQRTLDMLDYVCGAKSGGGVYDFCDMYGGRFPELYEKTRIAVWGIAANGGDLSAAAAAAQSAISYKLRNAYPTE